MRTNTKSAFLIALLALMTYQSFAQELSMPSIKLQTAYVGPYRVPTGAATQSTPSHTIYKNEGADFEITLTIVVQDTLIFTDTLFCIVCVMPDNSVQKLLFNPENIIVHSPQEYSYSFRVRTKSDGWIQVYVALKSEIAGNADPRFYKHSSNKESDYLRTVPQ